MSVIDFEAFVDADGLTGSAFLDAYENPLFERFQGDVTPAVRAGRPLVGGTLYVESSATDAMIDMLRALEALGLHVRSFELIPVAEDVPAA